MKRPADQMLQDGSRVTWMARTIDGGFLRPFYTFWHPIILPPENETGARLQTGLQTGPAA